MLRCPLLQPLQPCVCRCIYRGRGLDKSRRHISIPYILSYKPWSVCPYSPSCEGSLSLSAVLWYLQQELREENRKSMFSGTLQRWTQSQWQEGDVKGVSRLQWKVRVTHSVAVVKNSLFSWRLSMGGVSVSSSTSPKCRTLWLGDKRQYHNLSETTNNNKSSAWLKKGHLSLHLPSFIRLPIFHWGLGSPGSFPFYFSLSF